MATLFQMLLSLGSGESCHLNKKSECISMHVYPSVKKDNQHFLFFQKKLIWKCCGLSFKLFFKKYSDTCTGVGQVYLLYQHTQEHKRTLSWSHNTIYYRNSTVTAYIGCATVENGLTRSECPHAQVSSRSTHPQCIFDATKLDVAFHRSKSVLGQQSSIMQSLQTTSLAILYSD